MNPKTILIAEDDALLREALYEKLTREGFMVRIARDGEECVEEAFESYLEDVDFGLRCAAANLTGWYFPAAICWHHRRSSERCSTTSPDSLLPV